MENLSSPSWYILGVLRTRVSKNLALTSVKTEKDQGSVTGCQPKTLRAKHCVNKLEVPPAKSMRYMWQKHKRRWLQFTKHYGLVSLWLRSDQQASLSFGKITDFTWLT